MKLFTLPSLGKLVSGLLPALLLTATTGLVHAQQAAADKPAVIRLSWSQAGTGGRPVVGGSVLASSWARGVLEKEFEKDGIRIQWTLNPGAGPATNEQLANGLADFGSSGDLPYIIGRSTGLKSKILFSQARFGSSYITVPSDSSAKTVNDLKGKRLAVFKGTSNQLSLARILKKHGLSESDFKTVSMDGDNTRAAIAPRNIDAALIAPFDLDTRGVGKRLFSTAGDPSLGSLSVFWVSEEFEKKYPQIVQRVVNAFIRDAVWGTDPKNADEQYKLWSATGTSYNQYKEIYSQLPFSQQFTPLLDAYYRAGLVRAISEAKEYKLIRRDVDIASAYAPQYLDTALRDLNLRNHFAAFDAEGKPVKAGD